MRVVRVVLGSVVSTVGVAALILVLLYAPGPRSALAPAPSDTAAVSGAETAAPDAGRPRCPTCKVAGSCTDIVVAKKASDDGSVITSHTADCWYDSRLEIKPAADHKPGTMAPVYEWIIYEDRKPLEKLGTIPQVPHTYKYFDVGYPFANEHQVLIGETTIGGNPKTKNSEHAIMTIEQLETFCLQRTKSARECIRVMGALAETYGYRESCYLGEALTVTDPNEAWIFEIFGTGPTWTKASGKPGAVWAAQRVPDNHVTVVPNVSRIARIDPNDKNNFIVSKNYIQTAIDLGLYNPADAKPFVWRNVYGDMYKHPWKDGAMSRLWRVFSMFAPAGNWKLENSLEYPFSIKPEKPVSVRAVMGMYRDILSGTPYGMMEDKKWIVKTEEGEYRSPLATPQPDPALTELLGLNAFEKYRPIAVFYCSYFFVSQARAALPNDIGGVLWFGLDNPQHSPFIPVYMGTMSVPDSWKHLDRSKLDRQSAWWAFALVDDLVNKYYGVLKPQVDDVLQPMQQNIYASQAAVEQTALALYKKDPKLARQFLTNYTSALMVNAEKAYWELSDHLLFELNNNRPDCGGYLQDRYLKELKSKK
jgi:dipeptidase